MAGRRDSLVMPSSSWRERPRRLWFVLSCLGLFRLCEVVLWSRDDADWMINSDVNDFIL